MKYAIKFKKMPSVVYVSDKIVKDYDNMVAINELTLGLYQGVNDYSKVELVDKFYRNNQVRVSELK